MDNTRMSSDGSKTTDWPHWYYEDCLSEERNIAFLELAAEIGDLLALRKFPIEEIARHENKRLGMMATGLFESDLLHAMSRRPNMYEREKAAKAKLRAILPEIKDYKGDDCPFCNAPLVWRNDKASRCCSPPRMNGVGGGCGQYDSLYRSDLNCPACHKKTILYNHDSKTLTCKSAWLGCGRSFDWFSKEAKTILTPEEIGVPTTADGVTLLAPMLVWRKCDYGAQQWEQYEFQRMLDDGQVVIKSTGGNWHSIKERRSKIYYSKPQEEK